MNAYIMSAKFTPGLFSHNMAYYDLFKASGFESYLLLNAKYSSFTEKECGYRSIFLGQKHLIIPDALLIQNLSLYDSHIIRQFKRCNPEVKIYFVYHEPWRGFRELIINTLFKWRTVVTFAKAVIVYALAKSVLKNANLVLLPTSIAREYYEKSGLNKYNPNYVVFPLIFTNELRGQIEINKKQYFSFISTAGSYSGFDIFVKYIKHRAQKDSYSLFQIATRSNISPFIDLELKQLIEEKRLIINHGHSLSNEEINHAYAISNCTWLLYRFSTQSGVLPKSFMFGTPVIASNIGSFSDFINDKNGIILNDNYTFEDVDAAYDKIHFNLPCFSKNARESFLRNFYWESVLSDFEKLLIN